FRHQETQSSRLETLDLYWVSRDANKLEWFQSLFSMEKTMELFRTGLIRIHIYFTSETAYSSSSSSPSPSALCNNLSPRRSSSIGIKRSQQNDEAIRRENKRTQNPLPPAIETTTTTESIGLASGSGRRRYSEDDDEHEEHEELLSPLDRYGGGDSALESGLLISLQSISSPSINPQPTSHSSTATAAAAAVARAAENIEQGDDAIIGPNNIHFGRPDFATLFEDMKSRLLFQEEESNGEGNDSENDGDGNQDIGQQQQRQQRQQGRRRQRQQSSSAGKIIRVGVFYCGSPGLGRTLAHECSRSSDSRIKFKLFDDLAQRLFDGNDEAEVVAGRGCKEIATRSDESGESKRKMGWAELDENQEEQKELAQEGPSLSDLKAEVSKVQSNMKHIRSLIVNMGYELNRLFVSLEENDKITRQKVREEARTQRLLDLIHTLMAEAKDETSTSNRCMSPNQKPEDDEDYGEEDSDGSDTNDATDDHIGELKERLKKEGWKTEDTMFAKAGLEPEDYAEEEEEEEAKRRHEDDQVEVKVEEEIGKVGGEVMSSYGDKTKLYDEAQILGEAYPNEFEPTIAREPARSLLYPILCATRDIAGSEKLTIVTTGTRLCIYILTWAEKGGSIQEGYSSIIISKLLESFLEYLKFECMEFPGWVGYESVSTYITNLKGLLKDEAAKTRLDELLPSQAVELMVKKLVGCFRPITKSIEKTIEFNTKYGWKRAVDLVEKDLVSYDLCREKANLCYELIRLERKFTQNIKLSKDFKNRCSAHEILKLLLFQRYMYGDTSI
ncbi:hypothetical protein BX616_003172, partial [Lobosporangium transversale]